jgi:RNA polymerase sigma-70 factor (ECF subfamily)
MERRDLFNGLIQRYWRPVYFYVRRTGSAHEEAEDRVQGFFAFCIEQNLFAKADPARGRFRNLLLSSLNHYLANEHRREHAQKRHPQQGFVNIHDLASGESEVPLPAKDESPEAAFHRVWILDLLMRVLQSFKEECNQRGQETHRDLFLASIIEPILEGSRRPPMAELAERFGLTKDEGEDRLLAARRKYQRLLREEIGLFANSDEEVAAEIQDIFRFLAES